MAAALALLVVGSIAWLWAAPVEQLTFRSTDDSYYYFNVARHIVLGDGATFDGINPTYGFHPLWMLCLLPVFALAGAAPEPGLRAAFSLLFVVAGFTAWLAYRTTARCAGTAAAFMAVLALGFPVFLNPLLNGLETGLLALLLFALIHSAHRWDLLAPAAGVRRDALLGALLAAVFLTRLDTVFLLVAVFGAIVVRWARDPAPRRPSVLLRKLAATVGVVAALLLPYFAWGLVRFGHAMPISGDLKSSFPHPGLSLGSLMGLGLISGAGSLAVSALALLLLRGLRRPPGAPRVAVPGILAALWVGSVLHFLHTILFMRWGAHWWHYASYGPMTVLLAVLAVAALRARFLRARFIAPVVFTALAVSAAGGFALDARLRGGEHHSWYEAALWARAHLPPQAVVGMRECGLFGYFCGRPTVNLDGVINGYGYQDALRDHSLGRYLAACGVSHIADIRTRYDGAGRCVLRLPAFLHGGPGGAIVATRGAEVFTTEPRLEPSQPGLPRHDAAGYSLAIWELRKVLVVEDASRLP